MSGRGRTLRRRASWLLAASLLSLPMFSLACSDKRDDGTAPRPLTEELPAIELRDDTANLLLTWIDDKGETHVELHPPDVPQAGRAMVRAVLSDREAGTRDLVYVADLTQKGADGTYAVRTMRRRAWEELIAQRRAEHVAKTTPASRPAAPSGEAPASPPRPQAAGAVRVIIYGASWCRPCHQAAEHARAKGATVIMKDIEEDPAAAAEMQAKLEKARRRGGSIPNIDIQGQIMVGFSPSALDQALSRAAAGTVL